MCKRLAMMILLTMMVVCSAVSLARADGNVPMPPDSTSEQGQ